MTTQRLQLLHRIGRRYQTKASRFKLGKLELPFVRIADPDRVLDEVVADEERRRQLPQDSPEEPSRVPYWAQLWESAQALAQVLGRMPLEDLSVLDLGCGMGLAGAAAAAMGARVLMADVESPALLLSRLNTWPWSDRVRVRRVNWQADRLGERFDLILGADILYEKDQWTHLDSFWRAHLAPAGAVLLGEPGRSTGDAFGQWAKDRRWIVEQSLEPIPDANPVRIFQLRCK